VRALPAGRAATVRFSAATICEIEAARHREFMAGVGRNTQAMFEAEHAGYVSELRDHYPGFAWWTVPKELTGKVGCYRALVRA
jgi:hypothetical protein